MLLGNNKTTILNGVSVVYASTSCLLFTTSFIFYTNWNLELIVINRLILYSIVVCLLLSLTAMLSIHRHIKIRLTWFDFLFLLWGIHVFVITLCYSAFTDFEPELSDLGILAFVYANFRIYNAICTEKKSWLLYSFFIAGIIQIGHGLSQYVGILPNLYNGYNLGASFGNPGIYAGFLLLYLPFGLGAILNYNHLEGVRTKRFYNYIVYPLTAVSLFLVYISFSRAAWVGVLCAVILLFYFRYAPLQILKRKHFISLSVAAGIAGVTLLLFWYRLKVDSANGRLLIWKVSTQMVSEYPFTGMGYGAFARNYNVFQADYFSKHRIEEEVLLAESVSYAFNEYLRLLIETGIIGLCLFILSFTVLIRSIISSRVDGIIGVKECALASIVSIFCFAFFSYPFESIPIMIGFIFVISWIVDEEKTNSVIIEKKWLVKNISIVFLLLATGFFMFFAFKRTSAYVGFSKAMRMSGKITEAEFNDRLNRQYLSLKHDKDFLAILADNLFKLKKHDKSLEVINQLERKIHTGNMSLLKGHNYKALGNYEEAAKAYMFAALIEPHRMAPVFELAVLYDELNDKSRASHWSKQVLAMKVKVTSPKSIYYQIKAKQIADKYQYQ